jgi:hypothetical protein
MNLRHFNLIHFQMVQFNGIGGGGGDTPVEEIVQRVRRGLWRGLGFIRRR